jgi:hypothetical protein
MMVSLKSLNHWVSARLTVLRMTLSLCHPKPFGCAVGPEQGRGAQDRLREGSL